MLVKRYPVPQLSIVIIYNCTVKSGYKEPAYKELSVIRNWLSIPIFSKELVH